MVPSATQIARQAAAAALRQQQQAKHDAAKQVAKARLAALGAARVAKLQTLTINRQNAAQAASDAAAAEVAQYQAAHDASLASVPSLNASAPPTNPQVAAAQTTIGPVAGPAADGSSGMVDPYAGFVAGDAGAAPLAANSTAAGSNLNAGLWGLFKTASPGYKLADVAAVGGVALLAYLHFHKGK